MFFAAQATRKYIQGNHPFCVSELIYKGITHKERLVSMFASIYLGAQKNEEIKILVVPFYKFLTDNALGELKNIILIIKNSPAFDRYSGDSD